MSNSIKTITLLTLFVAAVAIHCTTDEDEEPLFTHLYGWVKTQANIGIDGLLLKIIDIDPDKLSQWRQRETITITKDSIPGYFEMDSVVFGTTKMQGTGYVTIILDSLEDQNKEWPTHIWYPNLFGEIDTLTLYISK